MINFDEYSITRIDDENAGIITDLSPTSETLVIIFSGLQGKFGGIPAFEFLQMTSNYPIKRIFLRDRKRVWYHEGIPELGNSIDAVADSLRAIIAEQQVQRVVTLGTSAGGYAALLFGYLLNVDRVVAFGPQTALSLFARLRSGDFRFSKRVRQNYRKLYDSPGYNRHYADLSKLFRTRSVKTKFEIYYSTAYRVDRGHALRMKQFKNVTLHGYPKGGHGIAKHFRNTGRLKPILEEAFGIVP